MDIYISGIDIFGLFPNYEIEYSNIFDLNELRPVNICQNFEKVSKVKNVSIIIILNSSNLAFLKTKCLTQKIEMRYFKRNF